MLKRIPPRRAQELVANATAVPTSDPRVSYPGWYLRRWHFLPEGYLSGRSAAWYDHVVRNLYNQGAEGRIIRAAIEQLKRIGPGSLLEVGCGPGRLLSAAARAGVARDRVGMDLSPYLLDRARSRLGGSVARLVHGDGLAIPSEDFAFDAAVSSHYVGHLPNNLRPLAVTELARVLRPGGHLLVLDHRWHSWPETDALRRVRVATRNFGLMTLTLFERTEAPAVITA